MRCEKCQAAEASVHLTQVAEDGVRKLHLCAGCAEQSGLDLQDPTSIADTLLLGLGQKTGAKADAGAACPRCSLKRSDFKRTGRLGCPECYTAFRRELHPLIRSMHRADRHTGKVPPPPGGDAGRVSDTEAERKRLQAMLDKAVAREAFEEAARIRDRIRQIAAPKGRPESTSS